MVQVQVQLFKISESKSKSEYTWSCADVLIFGNLLRLAHTLTTWTWTMTPRPTGRKPNSAASSSSRLPTPVGNQRRTSSRLTPPIITTSRSTAHVIIQNRETGELSIFTLQDSSMTWILAAALTVFHLRCGYWSLPWLYRKWFLLLFTLQVFSMDILSSLQIRLGLPPSYPHDHCSCTKSSSTQALVDTRHSFSSGGMMLLHPPNTRPWWRVISPANHISPRNSEAVISGSSLVL